MSSAKKSTLAAMFLAILLLLALTPLGFVTLGSLNPTTMYIPIIVGSIVLEPEIGSMSGGTLGTISLTKNTTTPTPLSFAFSPFIPVIDIDHGSWEALLIVPTPWILIGVVPYFTYKWLDKLAREKVQPISLFVADVLGPATNTILVMNVIYFLFNLAYAEIIGRVGTAVYLATIAMIFNPGAPKALVADVAASVTANVLLRLIERDAT